MRHPAARPPRPAPFGAEDRLSTRNGLLGDSFSLVDLIVASVILWGTYAASRSLATHTSHAGWHDSRGVRPTRRCGPQPPKVARESAVHPGHTFGS